MVASIRKPKPDRIRVSKLHAGECPALLAYLRALARLADAVRSSKAPDAGGEGQAMRADPTARVLTCNPSRAIVCTVADDDDVIAWLRQRWPIPERSFTIETKVGCDSDPARVHYLVSVWPASEAKTRAPD